MPRDAADLLNDALGLTEHERARLARALIDSLEADEDASVSPSELESAWRAEIERREREIEEDPTRVIPFEQVLADAERKLREIRNARERQRRSG